MAPTSRNWPIWGNKLVADAKSGNTCYMPRTKRADAAALTDDHKAALARGREQGRIVRNYLEALERNRPKRGRKRTPDSIQRKLEELENKLSTSDPLTRLHLLQQRRNLEEELRQREDSDMLDALEQAFIEVAADYSERKGISFAVWKEMGVPSNVLTAAGIKRA